MSQDCETLECRSLTQFAGRVVVRCESPGCGGDRSRTEKAVMNGQLIVFKQ